MTHGLIKDIWCHVSDIRPHMSAVSLVIADGQLIFLRGLCGYLQVNITLSPPLFVPLCLAT